MRIRFRGDGVVLWIMTGTIVLALTTCEKPERILKFETLEAVSTDISSTAAILKGEVTDLGSKPVEQHGLLLSESSVPAIGQQNTMEKPLGTINKKGAFQAQFTGLKANTTYYFRAFVVVDGTPELASIKQFQTPDSQLPSVTAGTVTGITMTSASLNGEVTSDGGEPATVRGLCWGLSANPTIATSLDTTKNGTGAGTFSGNMTGLTAGTQYYARTYAINSKGTSYNNSDIIFKTHNLPVVTTAAVSNITETGASSGGEVTDDGAVTVTARGVCWSTTTGPTAALVTKTSDGTGEGVFTSSITGLTSGTTYYVRAYATNQYGTSYGAELSFTASSTILPPSATTGSATPVGTTTATLNGSLNANGLSATATFEYGTTTAYGQSVTAAQSPVTGSSATSVSASVTGLSPSTTYHFRVKAVSTGGTAYGDDVVFTTSSSMATVNDFDGNTYNIITIGTQEWLQLNLKTEHYNNGDLIPEITDNVTWSGVSSGALCYYNNDEAAYKSAFGALYNWYAVNDVRNLCPVGWHSPTDGEWSTLKEFLGGENVAGGKLKEAGTANWSSPNSGATNETGFTAYPTGYRAYNGGDGYIGLFGYWWSATEETSLDAWYNFMACDHEAVVKLSGSFNYGFAVRCIKGAIPLVSSSAASSATSSSATLNGKVNPNGASATVTFEYGITTSYGSEATAAQSPASGFIPVDVSANITGLTGSTTYHYRVKAVNSGGTAYGKDMTFTTSSAAVPATVTTESASSVTSSGATLHGTVNANNYNAVVTFEYGTTTLYGSEVTASQSPVSGGTDTQVSASVNGLNIATTYHFRVKAVSTGGTSYGDDKAFTTSSSSSTVTDFDGNIYNTVQIGSQIWMAENLKTTHYTDGSQLVNGTSAGDISNDYTTKYQFVYDDIESNAIIYGRLYTWAAVLNGANSSASNPSGVQGVCPTGWHVPSISEWTELIDYLGGESVAGGSLKEAGNTHWLYSNVGATNTSGFTGLPHGYRNNNADFYGKGTYGAYSTSTSENSYSHRAIMLRTENAEAYSGDYNRDDAEAVRCVKDE